MKKNFESFKVKKKIKYIHKILIPEQIIKTINELDKGYAFEETLYEEDTPINKMIKKAKIEIYFCRKQMHKALSIFPEFPCNYITVCKTQEKINENDILKIKEIIYKVLTTYESFLNSDADDYFTEIEKINLGIKCSKCKLLTICENLDDGKKIDKNCKIYFEHYKKQLKEKNPFDIEFEKNKILKILDLMNKIEDSKKILNIETKENKHLKNLYSEEQINNYFKNSDLTKMIFYKAQ